jgi:hypothetical protein
MERQKWSPVRVITANAAEALVIGHRAGQS